MQAATTFTQEHAQVPSQMLRGVAAPCPVTAGGGIPTPATLEVSGRASRCGAGTCAEGSRTGKRSGSWDRDLGASVGGGPV